VQAARAALAADTSRQVSGEHASVIANEELQLRVGTLEEELLRARSEGCASPSEAWRHASALRAELTRALADRDAALAQVQRLRGEANEAPSTPRRSPWSHESILGVTRLRASPDSPRSARVSPSLSPAQHYSQRARSAEGGSLEAALAVAEAAEAEALSSQELFSEAQARWQVAADTADGDARVHRATQALEAKLAASAAALASAEAQCAEFAERMARAERCAFDYHGSEKGVSHTNVTRIKCEAGDQAVPTAPQELTSSLRRGNGELVSLRLLRDEVASTDRRLRDQVRISLEKKNCI